MRPCPCWGSSPYDLLGVAPGVTGAGTLGGSANTTNDVVANGQYLNINAGGRSYESESLHDQWKQYHGLARGRQSPQPQVLPDALSEMRVSTNDYDAQYGGKPE